MQHHRLRDLPADDGQRVEQAVETFFGRQAAADANRQTAVETVRLAEGGDRRGVGLGQRDRRGDGLDFVRAGAEQRAMPGVVPGVGDDPLGELRGGPRPALDHSLGGPVAEARRQADVAVPDKHHGLAGGARQGGQHRRFELRNLDERDVVLAEQAREGQREARHDYALREPAPHRRALHADGFRRCRGRAGGGARSEEGNLVAAADQFLPEVPHEDNRPAEVRLVVRHRAEDSHERFRASMKT
jgi:hypothetical protein